MLEIKTQPRVVITIINWKAWKDTIECLESVYTIDYKNYYTIVIDNGSNDESVDQIKKWADKNGINYKNVKFKKNMKCNVINSSEKDLVIIENDENFGFSKANNIGARIADGDYVVFLNNDAIVDKHWLNELVVCFENGDDVVACSSKIMFYSERSKVNYAGGQLTLLGKGIEIGFNETDKKSLNNASITGSLCGCSLIIRKEIFLSVGGFNENYFSYHEDSDLSWRLWIYGYKLQYVPSSIVYHKFRGSWTKKHKQRVVYGVCNRACNIVTNLELRNMFLGLFVHAFYVLGEITAYSLTGQILLVPAILTGTLCFLRSLPFATRKREVVQTRRRKSDDYLIKRGILLGFQSIFSLIIRSFRVKIQSPKQKFQ